MSKIIRTPKRAEGGITPDEKEQMDAIAQSWIANAMRTDRADLDSVESAITRLYAAAGLCKPRIVLVPSPMVMAFASGAAAAIWYKRKNPTDAATDAVTYAATDAATA
ncbi:MAG: hypothetical protein ACPGVG_16390, partial [Mycobacterium sp.]